MIYWLEKNRGISILLAALIAIEFFVFSSLPGGPSGTGGGMKISIIYHLIVFFLFGFFFLMSIKGDKEIKTGYIVTTLIISVLYAFLDEFHQTFVPFRNPSIQDILTDTAGIFLSTILILYLNKKKF